MLKINLSKIKQSRFYIVIVLTTFIIYGNSINNEYSLDDNIVVDGVEKVNKGLKAIPSIFTTHHAVDKKQSYGYRPLVSVSFALEKQFFGGLPDKQSLDDKKRKDKLTQANVSHFVNVLIYALTGMALFKFLLLLFKGYNKLLPFIITFIFIIHPLHTEPVCNIKSRDELLMLLCMLLALIQYLKYAYDYGIKHLIYACLFVFMAFLSKKSSLALVGIIPVVLYFTKTNYKKIIVCISTIIGFALVIVLMKKGLISEATSRDIKFFENPLLYQGGIMDRILMGFYCSWFYFKMLIFPLDMSYYYGYNHIPMANWSHYQVWLGLLIYIPLGVYGVIRFLKRDIIGLGIVLWFGIMLAFINVLFPIVGIVADRFAYVFSLGFCIVIGALLVKFFKIDESSETVQLKLSNGFVGVFVLITLIYSGRVIARNPDWHDYLTTYYTDIEVVEESAKAHAMISNTLYAFVKQNPQHPNNVNNLNDIIKHYKRALEIDSTYLTCYSNLGSAYVDLLQDYQSAFYYCRKAIEMDNDYLEANLNLAVAYDRTNVPDSAYKYYIRVIEIDPTFPPVYNMYTGLIMNNGMTEKGLKKLEELAASSSAPKFAYMSIANVYSVNPAQINTALMYFEKAFSYDKSDKILCSHIAQLYLSQGNQEKANYHLNICNSLASN